MERRRGDTQPLGPLRHGRIVDRLDVDAVLGEQQVARLFAFVGLADEYWNDMRGARHDRQSGGVEHRLDTGGALLVALALEARSLEVPDGGGRCGADRGRQRGGKNETG